MSWFSDYREASLSKSIFYDIVVVFSVLEHEQFNVFHHFKSLRLDLAIVYPLRLHGDD